ncbi:MAG: hypothetical protein QOE93_2290 [Actinomycetota bacterium]|jgi:hypothetical protein|nr:hypothetical protein [Actinomycetota bacterium]
MKPFGVTGFANAHGGRRRLAVVAALVVGTVLGPVEAARASTVLSVAPDFGSTPVTVGQDNLPATLTVTNFSTGSEETGTVTIESLTLVPSCSVLTDDGCNNGGSIADPKTFALSPTGTGESGTACASRLFDIDVTNLVTGEVTFTPATGGAVVLGAPNSPNNLDTCRIIFTVNVNKVPNHDSGAIDAGVQTAQVASATGRHQAGNQGFGVGSNTTTVIRGTPTMATQATPSVTLTQPISDTATVTGGGTAVPPTGDVTFTLFGPDNTSCVEGAIDTSFGSLSGLSPSTARSEDYTPTTTGVYRWVAVYSGDNNYTPVSGCNSGGETSTVTALPVITVEKTATPLSRTVPGGDFTFGVVVTNASSELLTITSLVDSPYGNLAARAQSTCTTAIGKALQPSPDAGHTYSCSFTAPFTGAPGASQTDTVTVTATNPSGVTVTDNDDATVTITKAVAAIQTLATPSATIGGSISDTATVTGAVAPAPTPTGTVTFTLYAPANTNCELDPIFTSAARPLAGGPPPTATSSPFAPAAAGSYRWKAAYSGDDNYTGVTGACNATGETSTVAKATPTISTQASAGNLLGAPVRDVATLTGGSSPTGNVTFRLFSNNTCGTEVFSSTNALSGPTATSGWFIPAAPGTYYWTAVYGGDGANNSVTSPCQAPNESVTIVPFTAPTVTRTITGDLAGPVTVAAGESVLVTDARVVGPITVNPGGALTVTNGQITRGITVNGPSFLSICGSRVSGPSPGVALSVSNALVPTRIGDPVTGCAGNTFAGQVNLTSDLAVVFGANTVSHTVTVTGGGPGNTVVKANNIFGTLACSGNAPPPTNLGQVNTAASKTGQCAGL